MSRELFDKFMNENKLLDAYLVIKNMYAKNLDNVDVFKAFFELGLRLAMFDVEFSERKNYLNEASNSLALFSDNANLSEDVVVLIKECEKKIAEVYNSIIFDEEKQKEEAFNQIVIRNNEALKRLNELLEEIKTIVTQKAFDEKLKEISAVEEQLSKTNFTESQENSYQILSKHFSNVISKKMEEINKLELVELNKKAISTYKQVFETYIANKEKYKENESNLKALVYHTLFAFDTRDLFNESLIYYNHIYSMIFNEVNDKVQFTRDYTG
ncbi:hypothetical protein ACTQ1U_14080 [Thermoguttaceae bacterium LCP21S3_D4]